MMCSYFITQGKRICSPSRTVLCLFTMTPFKHRSGSFQHLIPFSRLFVQLSTQKRHCKHSSQSIQQLPELDSTFALETQSASAWQPQTLHSVGKNLPQRCNASYFGLVHCPNTFIIHSAVFSGGLKCSFNQKFCNLSHKCSSPVFGLYL